MMSKMLVVFASCAALANAAVVPRQATTTLGGNIISVTGAGSVDIPTTQTQVSASIEKTTTCEPDADTCSGQEAQQDVAKSLSGVLDYLKGVDSVSKLTTNNVQLMPQYNYSASPPEVTGYTASSTISFQVDNDEAGDVLDQIVAEGATSIGSVSFVASDSAIAKATDEALKKAVANGQAQAKAVLEAIDAKEVGIVGVQIGNAQPPTPVPAPGPVMAMASAAPGMEDSAPKTQVEPGTQTVSASVTLNIKYEQ